MAKNIIISIVSLFLLFNFQIINAQQNQDDPILMTINNEKISKSEFLNVYKKNNVNSQVIDKKTLDEYLNLYINFKLKVCEAKDMGLDTTKAFKTELKGYRDQLAQPYLTDKEVTEDLIKEAYERMKYDVRTSHILIKVAKNASPKDTLAAFNKISKIRERILKGESFEKLAQEESEDPSAKDNLEKKYQGNKGDLGFFTVFDMIYPFETTAYNTKVGEMSKPVRTEYGYHLIKVTDRKDAMGKVQVAHIYVSVPKNVTDKDSLKKYENKINDIYNKLKGGTSYDELAKQYSDDKGSAAKGGALPPFGVNRMVPEFIVAISELKNKDDYSKPIQTPYGWHIVKLIEKKGIGTFEDKKAEIKSKIAKDTRSYKSKESFIARVKKLYNFKEYIPAKKEFYKVITDSIFNGKWKLDLAKDLKKPLFSIGDTTYNQQDFSKYIFSNQTAKEKQSIEALVDNLYKDYVDDAAISYEDRNLEKRYIDFRLLMNEYRDGILLFDLTDKKVWSKAVKDTLGMEEFHKKNVNKYMWDERLNASIYTCSDDKVALNTHKLLKKALKKNYTDKDILELINKDTKEKKATKDAKDVKDSKNTKDIKDDKNDKVNLKIETNNYSKGDNAIIDSIAWTPGITNDFKKGGNIIFVVVNKKVAPEPKSLKEARGLVTADYQNYLEQEWINYLKNKYKVIINKEVLTTIK